VLVVRRAGVPEAVWRRPLAAAEEGR
jgi:hypothetical protein